MPLYSLQGNHSTVYSLETLSGKDLIITGPKPGRKRRPLALLHIDSALPHLMAQKFDDLGINRLHHLPYSLVLAPCDFELLPYLKNMFERSFFDDLEELGSVIEEGLVDLNVGQWVKVDYEWIPKSPQCIDGGGEYLEWH
jgi:hypothetical protein